MNNAMERYREAIHRRRMAFKRDILVQHVALLTDPASAKTFVDDLTEDEVLKAMHVLAESYARSASQERREDGCE